MKRHEVRIKSPTTLGGLIGALNRVVTIQSMVADGDIGYGRLLELESRLPRLRKAIEEKLGMPLSEADPTTRVPKSFSNQLLHQLTV